AERLRGFFLQDPTGDGDPETSDGVFVFDGDGGALGERTEGERLRVTGVVSEYFGQTQLTQLRAVTSCGRGSVPISPFEGPLELDRLEAIEGMRVRFEQPLTVVDSWGLGSYGELLLAAGGRPWWGEEPGLLGALVLDDGSDRRDPRPVPYLSGERTVRLGDRVVGLEGVLGFAYGHFRVQPTGVVAFEERNARPQAPRRGGGRAPCRFYRESGPGAWRTASSVWRESSASLTDTFGCSRRGWSRSRSGARGRQRPRASGACGSSP